MSNTFPGDLYGRLMDEDLGPDYFQVGVSRVELLLINDWLVDQSCFYIVLPLPDDRYEITVKVETRRALERALKNTREWIGRVEEGE